MQARRLEKNEIGIFNIDEQTLVGIVDIEKADREINRYRNDGYSIAIDSDGDICISKDYRGDTGETYKEMLK